MIPRIKGRDEYNGLVHTNSMYFRDDSLIICFLKSTHIRPEKPVYNKGKDISRETRSTGDLVSRTRLDPETSKKVPGPVATHRTRPPFLPLHPNQ